MSTTQAHPLIYMRAKYYYTVRQQCIEACTVNTCQKLQRTCVNARSTVLSSGHVAVKTNLSKLLEVFPLAILPNTAAFPLSSSCTAAAFENIDEAIPLNMLQ
eukprot:3707-Heterococcus_DN1.PRE.3